MMRDVVTPLKDMPLLTSLQLTRFGYFSISGLSGMTQLKVRSGGAYMGNIVNKLCMVLRIVCL